MNVKLPSAAIVIVPTPGIVAVSPAVNTTGSPFVSKTPATVKVSTVKSVGGVPEPVSLVKTFPVACESSATLIISFTI